MLGGRQIAGSDRRVAGGHTEKVIVRTTGESKIRQGTGPPGAMPGPARPKLPGDLLEMHISASSLDLFLYKNHMCVSVLQLVDKLKGDYRADISQHC